MQIQIGPAHPCLGYAVIWQASRELDADPGLRKKWRRLARLGPILAPYWMFLYTSGGTHEEPIPQQKHTGFQKPAKALTKVSGASVALI